MTDAERQASLDNISLEDLAKIEARSNKGMKIEIEDILLTEFALKFGWLAYKDARDDVIKGKEMMRLLLASRKLDSLQMYKDSIASFVGSASSQSKKPGQTFKTMTNKMLRSSEADT